MLYPNGDASTGLDGFAVEPETMLPTPPSADNDAIACAKLAAVASKLNACADVEPSATVVVAEDVLD